MIMILESSEADRQEVVGVGWGGKAGTVFLACNKTDMILSNYSVTSPTLSTTGCGSKATTTMKKENLK